LFVRSRVVAERRVRVFSIMVRGVCVCVREDEDEDGRMDDDVFL